MVPSEQSIPRPYGWGETASAAALASGGALETQRLGGGLALLLDDLVDQRLAAAASPACPALAGDLPAGVRAVLDGAADLPIG